MAAVSRHCCSNKRTLIKYGYLKPVRLCNKCNASCFKADLLLNAVCTSRGVRARVRVCMASNSLPHKLLGGPRAFSALVELR
jgi:hypothetical protein